MMIRCPSMAAMSMGVIPVWATLVGVPAMADAPVETNAETNAAAQIDASANTPPPQRRRKPRNPHPAFKLPDFHSELPNVLLIGDSISIGYTVAVRKRLEGIANVYRPLTNCGPTTRGLAYLDSWVERPEAWSNDHRWDVIHFNFGLHDLKFMGQNGENLADPSAEGSHVQVPIDEYREHLKTIALKLKQTGATVIWRETTPVPPGARGRIVGDSIRYNEVAAEVMASLGEIQTDAFFAHAQSISDLQRPADVHYTPQGTEAQADHVAEVIQAALTTKDETVGKP